MLKSKKIAAALLSAVLLFAQGAAAGAEVPAAGESALDGIIIVSLPDPGDGVLTYGGRAVETGESVPAEKIDEIGFTPAGSEAGAYLYVPVYSDGTQGDITGATAAPDGFGAYETVQDSAVIAKSEESVNIPPTAGDLEIVTYRNLTVGGVLPVSDERAGFYCQVLTQPKSGVVTVSGASFVYTPYQNKTGSDSFTYIVRDSDGAWSREATVGVEVKRQKSAFVYRDTDGNAAEYAAVKLAESGVYMGRTLSGSLYFEPGEPIAKGEFIALAMTVLGYEPSAAASTFFADDEAIPVWTRSYITTAVREGIVSGEESGEGSLLRASGGLTLAEAAVITANAADFEAADTVLCELDDVPAWALSPVAGLIGSGIIAYDGAVDASQVLTRADAALMLVNLMTYRESQAVRTGFFSWITG